jgi:hypothetical protein
MVGQMVAKRVPGKVLQRVPVCHVWGKVGVWGILDISCQLLSSNHPFLRMFICLLRDNPSVLTSSGKANGDNIYTP